MSTVRLNKNNKNTGILLALMSAVCYGTSPFFIETFYKYGGNTLTYTFLKNVLVIILMSVGILITGRSIRISMDRVLKLMIAGSLGCGLVTLLLTGSYSCLGGGVATTLHYMYPVFTALISWIFLKKKMPAYKWILLVTVSLSIALFADITDMGANIRGIIPAVLSAVFFAVFIIISDIWKLGEEDPFIMMLYMAAGGLMIAVPAVFISGIPAAAFETKGLIYVLICTVVDVIIGNVLFQKSLNYLDGTETAFFSVLEPVTSVILNAVLLGEILTIRSAAGILIILGSILLMACIDNRVMHKNQQESENRK